MSFFSKIKTIKKYFTSHTKGLAMLCVGILGMAASAVLFGVGVGSIPGTVLFALSVSIVSAGCILSTNIGDEPKENLSDEQIGDLSKKLCEEFNLPKQLAKPEDAKDPKRKVESTNANYGTFRDDSMAYRAAAPSLTTVSFASQKNSRGFLPAWNNYNRYTIWASSKSLNASSQPLLPSLGLDALSPHTHSPEEVIVHPLFFGHR